MRRRLEIRGQGKRKGGGCVIVVMFHLIPVAKNRARAWQIGSGLPVLNEVENTNGTSECKLDDGDLEGR